MSGTQLQAYYDLVKLIVVWAIYHKALISDYYKAQDAIWDQFAKCQHEHL